jgi:hypothetical protein
MVVNVVAANVVVLEVAKVDEMVMTALLSAESLAREASLHPTQPLIRQPSGPLVCRVAHSSRV